MIQHIKSDREAFYKPKRAERMAFPVGVISGV
jgi:hypothetical protein